MRHLAPGRVRSLATRELLAQLLHQPQPTPRRLLRRRVRLGRAAAPAPTAAWPLPAASLSLATLAALAPLLPILLPLLRRSPAACSCRRAGSSISQRSCRLLLRHAPTDTSCGARASPAAGALGGGGSACSKSSCGDGQGGWLGGSARDQAAAPGARRHGELGGWPVVLAEVLAEVLLRCWPVVLAEVRAAGAASSGRLVSGNPPGRR
jgi:hypothetical protein